MGHNEIYYYNPKYPEYGIDVLPIQYLEWLSTSTSENAHKQIHAIGSKFNIETGMEEDFANYYLVYNPYPEDDDIFVHDLPGNRERILSFNREKLEEWWYEDVKTRYNIAKRRLEDLEECLNQK
jgi:hypothetical protein